MYFAQSMEELCRWDFDPFCYEPMQLVNAIYVIFSRFNCLTAFQIDLDVFGRFMHQIREHYQVQLLLVKHCGDGMKSWHNISIGLI